MIELKEHNIRPYKELCDMLEKHDKCAYVSATGTGKSYVVGKYIEEHDLVDKTLMLVPSIMIMKSWESLLPEIRCITYQSMTATMPDMADIKLIVCDEMHHLGSEVWGTRFREMLEYYSGKMIGTSATPIRYLDNCRNMAEEIFEGHIVEGYSLPQAISEGILPSFQYISTLYNMPKTKKYRSTKYTETLLRKLDWMENEYSVHSILKKYMPEENIKIAVFVDRIGELNNIRKLCRKCYPDASHLIINSGMKKSDISEALAEFQNTKKMSFLYTVDMLNEGIHIDGVRNIIMFRRTTSPAVYLQQLGRALSVNTDEVRPTVFDFVANHASITGIRCKSASGGAIQMLQDAIGNPERQIIIMDYSKEELEILHQLELVERGRWTKAEDDILRKNYKAKTDMRKVEELLPHRTKASINCRIGQLGLAISTPRYGKQFDEDIKTYFLQSDGMEKLKKIYPEANTLAIYRHAEKLGLHTPRRNTRRWTDDEITILMACNYDYDDPRWLEVLPGRNIESIRAKKGILLRANREERTIDEDSFSSLFQYGGADAVKQSAEFNWMSQRAIKELARSLGIKHIGECAWKQEEIDRMIEYLHNPERESIVQFALNYPKRTMRAVERQLDKVREIYGSVERTNIKKTEWTEDETKMIYDYLRKPAHERESVKEFSRCFPNRNYNAVKNKVVRERQKEVKQNA